MLRLQRLWNVTGVELNSVYHPCLWVTSLDYSRGVLNKYRSSRRWLTAMERGPIGGLVEGNLLTLRWDQPFNQRGGEAKLEISSDGETLTGRGTMILQSTIADCGAQARGTFKNNTDKERRLIFHRLTGNRHPAD